MFRAPAVTAALTTQLGFNCFADLNIIRTKQKQIYRINDKVDEEVDGEVDTCFVMTAMVSKGQNAFVFHAKVKPLFGAHARFYCIYECFTARSGWLSNNMWL